MSAHFVDMLVHYLLVVMVRKSSVIAMFRLMWQGRRGCCLPQNRPNWVSSGASGHGTDVYLRRHSSPPSDYGDIFKPPGGGVGGAGGVFFFFFVRLSFGTRRARFSMTSSLASSSHALYRR